MWPDDQIPEPAAWINFNAATGERNVSFVCESELASIPLWPEPPRPQLKPLTDEQLLDILQEINACTLHLPGGFRLFARAVEQAHGIGEARNE